MNEPRVALVGSPNSGKTTLFNALTGLAQKVANYPGVTVEHVEGVAQTGEAAVTLIDLPGTYALEPLSVDEQVTFDVLTGEMEGVVAPDAVLVVADATTLERSLQLVGEVLALGLPAALVVTMIDELKARGGAVKVPLLKRRLGIPVYGVVGNRGIGLDDVRAWLANPASWKATKSVVPADIESRVAWADEICAEAVQRPTSADVRSDALDKVLLHPVWGIAVFAIVMFLFFQVVFIVAAPLQDLFEGSVAAIGELVANALPPGLLRSLLVDGIIAGVGGVVVFVPQIALLVLMVALLEASGYMARAAFVIDRVMGWAGLEGRCFVALLSSYACAIPGIMATRGVPDPQSRLATIMVAPFMTCSARLPVYGLLIAAFVPAETWFGASLQGLVLFALYVLGSVGALLAAVVFKRGLLRGKTFPFYMELPPYRRPTARVVGQQVWRGVRMFLTKAGTIILAASVLLWVCLTFPQRDPPADIAGDEVAEATYVLEHSYAAQVGKALEPVFSPLGFDWRINIGLVASLAAREVIVATLAQIYAVEGGEEDVDTLAERLKHAKFADGTPVYTDTTVAALLVFFVFALQCVSTLAVIRRETRSWMWPAAAFGYMFVVAYFAGFVAHVAVSLLGG